MNQSDNILQKQGYDTSQPPVQGASRHLDVPQGKPVYDYTPFLIVCGFILLITITITCILILFKLMNKG